MNISTYDTGKKQTSAGSMSGYIVGGDVADASSIITSIDKFSFASEGNSVTISAIVPVSKLPGCGWSISAGYFFGGSNAGATTVYNTIDKFTFVNDQVTSSIATMTGNRASIGAMSTNSASYMSGGYIDSSGTMTNIIEKFVFASEGNSTNIGTMSENKFSTGVTWGTYTYGYKYSGQTGLTPNYSTRLEKFFFVYDGNSQNVLTISAHNTCRGVSSPTAGYIFGNYKDINPTGWTSATTIYKMLLSTETDASSIANLVVTAAAGAITCTLYNAYIHGGIQSFDTINYHDVSTIQKYGFASDGSSVSVGSLASGAHDSQGQMQY